MRRFLLPASRKPYSSARQCLTTTLSLGLMLGLSACATNPGAGRNNWDAAQLARREQRVTDGAIGSRNTDAETELRRQVCEIDRVACDAIRVYVVDRPEAQARLWPNDMLIFTNGLLRLINQTGSSAAAQLRFALAHELAHRQLGHFNRRHHAGWDADAAEREADAVAMESLRTSNPPPDSGIELLQLIIEQRGENSRGAERMRARIAAMRKRISREVVP
ncbi:MAG: M48 family metalloprotease [Xanthomonadales bacterium]|nr:M48 family metalloprotease [Xanthomonadales bacterium]